MTGNSETEFFQDQIKLEEEIIKAAEASVAKVENLLVKDDKGRIVGMVQPPPPTYMIPDRRGSQFFAP